MPSPSSPLVVLTPSGFTALSAEKAVLLSWNQTPLATSYVIRRSTDNVTFTDVGTSSSLSFNDTTGAVGTIYYYAVQASNGTSYGNQTLSIAGLALKPGQNTAGNIILEAQQRCDKVNSPFYSPQELMSMCSQSRKELYDILVQKFGDDYYLATPYTYKTSNQQQFYPLPDDFYKLLGVDVALNNGDPNSWVTLKEFSFIQRNLYNFPNVYTMYGITNLRYRLMGDQLEIVPVPSGGQTIQLWYAPRVSQLINLTDIVDGVSGWEEYIVVDMCIKMLTKEESDVTIYAGQKGALLKRIEEAAENRNIGEPETVSDSRRRNFSWGDPGDSGSGGFY